MMRRMLYCVAVSLLFVQCKNQIKNENGQVTEESGTTTTAVTEGGGAVEKENASDNPLLGFYVGYFENADKSDAAYEKYVGAGDAFYWDRANKINISLDAIDGDKLNGHSVVAGNDRPFTGTITQTATGYRCEVKEPGDDAHDGSFAFDVKGDSIIGLWSAYKKIEIPKRSYRLGKRSFTYKPEQALERGQRFIDWNKAKGGKKPADDEYYADFAGATAKIYSINASTSLLTKEEVQNLKRGDLLIIRNAIYARHGYSFKNRPLRVFFDRQDWYIPVHSDIKSSFTEIEKKNIELLLRYEKNAKEYYDYFGRG